MLAQKDETSMPRDHTNSEIDKQELAVSWGKRGFRVTPLWPRDPATGCCSCEDGKNCRPFPYHMMGYPEAENKKEINRAFGKANGQLLMKRLTADVGVCFDAVRITRDILNVELPKSLVERVGIDENEFFALSKSQHETRALKFGASITLDELINLSLTT